MEKYKNLFKELSQEKLKNLYEQFLDFEKTGVITGKELGEFKDQYSVWFESNPLAMVQYDLLHAIADLWYVNDRIPTTTIDRMHDLKKELKEIPVEQIESKLKQLSMEEMQALLRTYVYEGR